MKKRVVILYDNAEYNRYCNLIRYEELKGNIEVVGIVTQNMKMQFLDGWRIFSLEEVLREKIDYFVVSARGNIFSQMKSALTGIGILEEQIIPIGAFSIPNFDLNKYVKMQMSRPTIITNHCWGGFTYHSLNMEFFSPFINLFLKKDDYFRLLFNFEWYMSQELKYVGEEWEENQERMYPIGCLADVQIHFNHYSNFEEAKEKWDKRKEKMNWNNLFFEMYTTDEEDVEVFARIPFENKRIFTSFNSQYDCAIDISAYNEFCRDKQDFYSNVNKLATNELVYYDIFDLLAGKEEISRYKSLP